MNSLQPATYCEKLDASLIHQLLLEGHILEIHGVVQKVLRNGITQQMINRPK
jgi:hypothetical protein